MYTDPESVVLATRLVEEFGHGAVRMSRVRLVELIAANDVRAAAFWRAVLDACEQLLAGESAAGGAQSSLDVVS
jgi:hypothetical protein